VLHGVRQESRAQMENGFTEFWGATGVFRPGQNGGCAVWKGAPGAGTSGINSGFVECR